MKKFFYIKKIINLLENLKNPKYFIYILFHYLKKSLSIKYAQKLAAKNEKEYEADGVLDIKIKTYDGSNQCVHPDVVIWKDKLYLVVTPYPYGMEEYENPSVYYGDTLIDMIELSNNPIDKPLFQNYGYHLSDPCFIKDSKSLYCAYRITENRKINKIVYKKYLENNKWEKAKVLLKSEKDLLLSPAIAFIDDKIIMYHVCLKDLGSSIVYTIFNNKAEFIKSKEIKCQNLPKDYYIWHIGINFNDVSEILNKEKKIEGVFLLRNRRNNFKLFKAETSGLGKEWLLGEECIFNSKLKSIIKIPYKACLIPKTNQILMSYRDKKDRYRLTII